jgi:hypothetical protein
MKKLNPVIAVLTWPFRFAYDFVDARPSASQIKTHLNRHEPVIEELEPNSFTVSLQLSGTDTVAHDPDSKDAPRVPHTLTYSADKDESIPLAKASARAAIDGFNMARQQVNGLTRADFARDSKIVRMAAQLEKAAQPEVPVGDGGQIREAHA